MRVVGSLLMLVAVLTGHVYAQPTTVTVSGFPVTFPPVTAADLDAGILSSSTPTSFTVEITGGQPVARTTIVTLRCQAPCPVTGSKPAAQLQWRRADLPFWQTLSTTDVEVERRVVERRLPLPQSNNPWSATLYWQTLLDWSTDSPGIHTFDIVLTLTVTAP